MIRHHPIPWRHLTRAVLLLALAVGVAADRARANPEEDLPAPELEKQAYAKIVEARGSARAERYPEAVNRLDDAVSLAEQLEDKLPLALALHNKGEVELLRGRPLDALKAYYRVLGIYRRLGHEAGATLVQKRIGMLTRLVKKPEKPAAAPSQAAPAAKAPERLSLVDQAVERIRARVRSAGQKAAEETPPTPVEARRTGEPPAPVEPPEPVPTTPPEDPAPRAAATSNETSNEQSPARVSDAGTEEPRPPAPATEPQPPRASVQVARAESPSASDNPRQWAYVESLKRKISGRSRYPAYARRTGQQGTVALAFTVRENGELAGVEMSESSGFIVLDVEALRNVREAAPFGPVPARATPGPLTVRMTISYTLPAESDPAP